MTDRSTDGAAPEGGPIQAHLVALGAELTLPETALRACVARFGEAAQPLRALLDRAAAGKDLSEEDSLRFFRGLHVLAAARDVESCASLLRLLRRPADEVEDLLGDAVGVNLPRIVISLFDGDDEALLAAAADREADEFVRGAILDAAVYLAWKGRLDRERLRHFLIAFHAKRLAEDEACVWHSWMRAVALLDFRDLVPLVEAAWKAGRIDHDTQEWSEFGIDLARARTAYADESRFYGSAAGTVDDIVAELDWTRHWADVDARADAPAQPREDPADTPFVNPYRDIGRNDPCPCGSGKKAKKCCLATG